MYTPYFMSLIHEIITISTRSVHTSAIRMQIEIRESFMQSSNYILFSVIIVIVNEVNNPICVSTEAEQDKGKGQISPEVEVSIG